MFVESFRIDGFGIFANVQVNQLSPGLSIFLGNNEAGKSTCLEFLRAMLVDYARKAKNKRDYTPLRGGKAGGGLVLHTASHGLLHLTRRPGKGNVTLTTPDGENLQPALLDALLAGVTSDVYRSVFGFSLDELQQLASLNDKGIRNALYNASFGAGLRAPGTVMTALKGEMEDIFRPSGSNPILNKAITSLSTLKAELEKITTEYASYDSLAQELAETRSQLDVLRQNKNRLDTERNRLKRRLSAWDQWQAWSDTGLQLERLPVINAQFPVNGERRMEGLLKDHENRQQQVAAHKAKYQQLQERLASMKLDEALLEALPALRNLAELKGSYRQALVQLPRHKEQLENIREDLQRQLQKLGADWTCERIRNTDRSIFDREDMDRQAEEMRAAESSYKATLDTLNRSNREVADAENNIARVQEQLDTMPCPEAELDEKGRDNLRQLLGRYEEGLRQLPGEEHDVEQARTAFKRVWDSLKFPAANDEQESCDILDRLLQNQDSALALANEVQQCIQESNEANKAVVLTQEEADAVKSRMDALLHTQKSGTPTRDVLATKSNALRQLRAVTGSLKSEQDRLEELKARQENERKPSGNTSMPLIVIGILLCLVGAGIIAAHALWGISSYAITPGLEMPVNLWSGYLVLVCGVAFLGGGLPRSGPEAKRYKQDMEILRGRIEATALSVQEKKDQAMALCQAAQIPDWDEATILACEDALEQEREHCFREERILADMEAIRQEQAQVRTRLSVAQTKAHEKDTTVQQTRRRWHEFMQGLKVGNVPAPDAAQRFFIQVDSARMAVGTLLQANDKLDRHAADMEQIADDMMALAPVANRLGDDDDELTSDTLLAAVRATLDACREADNARERRLQAEAQLQAHEGELVRAQNRQAEIAEELRQNEERRKAATDAWTAKLQNLGLGLDLAPDTVREAFKCMDECLALETAMLRAQADINQTQADMDSLVEPLRTILSGLGRLDATLVTEAKPDWLVALDAALAAAEKEVELQTARKELQLQVDDAGDDLRSSEAALAEVVAGQEELLAQAETPTIDTFMAMAAAQAQRNILRDRRQELEDQLRHACDGDFEVFLDSFARLDRANEESQLATMDAQLVDMSGEEDSLLTRVGELSARVSSLSDGDALASQQQKISQEKTDMAYHASRWLLLAMTQAIIGQTKRQYERDRQPAVMQEASRIFRQITDGRWQGLNSSLEDDSIRILPADQSEPVGPEVLSRGTQEQVYLALRLAYIRNHAIQAEPLPLIMDDILVNFDPERAQRTANALARIATSGEGQQILYFTCHPHMVDILRKAQPDAPLYSVADGTISRMNTL